MCVSNVLLVCIYLALLIQVHCDDVTVRIKSGVVKGTLENCRGIGVRQYLGIPFAQPPVADLRFKKPLPLSDHGEISGTVWPPRCVQPSFKINGQDVMKFHSQVESEDCLFLNVWSPVSQNNSLKPVIFNIHGGGYEYGSSNTPGLEGGVLATMGDVVVVSMNYRLAVFGFMFAGSDETPGNVGLWDQTLALEWTRDNIEFFGGDPNRVTIMGDSAGGMSVANHILSPHSRYLFRNAIPMSGTSLSPEFHVDKDVILKRAHQVAKLANCEADDVTDTLPLTQQSLECLKQLSASDLIRLSKSEGIKPFVPIYGDEFLPIKPSVALRSGNYKTNTSILIGATNDEGSLIESLDQTPEMIRLRSSGNAGAWRRHLKKKLSESAADIDAETQDEIVDFYFSTADGTIASSMISYRQALGDVLLTCPAVLFAENVLNGNRVFGYHVTYKTNSVVFSTFCPESNDVCHGADMLMVMGMPFSVPFLFSDEDREESKHVIKIFSDFAKNDEVDWKAHQMTSSGFVLPYNYEINHQVSNPLKTDWKHIACKLWGPILLTQ